MCPRDDPARLASGARGRAGRHRGGVSCPMRLLFLLVAVALLPGCADPTDPAPEASGDAGAPTVRLADGPQVEPIEAPAGAESGRPRLSLTPDSVPLLSWTEPDGDGHALRYSLWRDGAWGEPETATRGTEWFVNWADTPGVLPLADGRLLAHWLPMHPDGDSPYAYDAAVSLGDGTDWTPEALLHDDGLAAEHGFVSAVPLATGAGVIWLDGREQAGGGHDHHGA
ncbi:MAG: hypothetical protein AAFQ43_09925, partial [Bacteroidota bacterium]